MSGGETTWNYNKGGIEPLKSFSANAGQLKRGEDPVGLDSMMGANGFKPSQLVEVGQVGGENRPDLNTQSNLGDDRWITLSVKKMPVGDGNFSWEEKLVAPLIATPNVDRAIEDKKDGQKKLRYRLHV